MLSERVTSAPRFNCTSSTPMNVQIGSRCVKLCRMFLKGRNTDMFHTCTNMTWSHFLILKPEILKWQTHMRFGSACSTNFFFKHFPFVVSVAVRLSSAFERHIVLHQTRREILGNGWLLLKVKLISARPQRKDEDWKAWRWRSRGVAL